MKYKFYRKVNEDGTISGAQDIRDAVKSFFGKDIEIVIQRKSNKRSNEQNKLFWSYMSILGHDLGYTKDEMHDIVCVKFLPKDERVIESTGEIIETTRGTSGLTTKEFTDLLEDVLHWALTELECNLPLPDQQVEIEY